MNVLGVIGARGGSKGLPDKHLRPLLGKPLIAWSIEQALACPEIERLVVSTDDFRIASVAREFGAQVPFMRPAELAGDTVGKWEVWQHALEATEQALDCKVDLFVDLDCTSPLRSVDDISAAIRQFRESDVDAVFSVCEARKNPYFNMVEYKGGRLRMCKSVEAPIVRRQAAPAVYEHVASIYVLSPEYLRTGSGLLSGRAVGYDIGADKSLDVDSELDFLLVEFLMRRQSKEGPA